MSEALSAHQEGDAARARAVWRRDGELDAHYDSLFGSLIAAMAQRPEEVARGAQRLFVAKNLEWVGDQARRVAAAAYWTATGEEVDADC